MSDDEKNQAPKDKQPPVLKRFDMYRFFSRTDVILAIIFVVILILVSLYAYLSGGVIL